MEYIKIGSNQMNVSKLAVGCLSFGTSTNESYAWTLDQEATTSLVYKALSLGYNFFDTANCYGNGTSEIYLGNALKNIGIARDQVVIASKVYHNEGHLSESALINELEQSLERLQTDYIDLYQIHRFDTETPIEETMETLNALVRSGKVRAIGASNLYGYQLQNYQHLAQEKGWEPFSTMQNQYNLLYREDERELIPVVKQYGMDLLCYSPLARGHLARPSWDCDSLRSKTDEIGKAVHNLQHENDLEIIARVNDIAHNLGVPMSAVSLAWLFHRGVQVPILGATKESHLEDALKAFDIHLTDREIEYMEEPYQAHELRNL